MIEFVILAGTLIAWQSDTQPAQLREPVVTIHIAVAEMPSRQYLVGGEMDTEEPLQPTIRVHHVEKAIGAVEDGYVLHMPAPT